jgi:hypothetical protein
MPQDLAGQGGRGSCDGCLFGGRYGHAVGGVSGSLTVLGMTTRVMMTLSAAVPGVTVRATIGRYGPCNSYKDPAIRGCDGDVPHW